jgi:excisionase family DNA binding protein
MAAELLTVSPDTVYDLFKRGELPGRKVGRKWLTTRNAVLRWIEISSENNTLAKAIERWCNRFLDARQWKQLQAVIRSARRDPSRYRTVRLSRNARDSEEARNA